MLIDHVGLYLLGNNIWFRIIGRIAMPIFAFFIAEGMKYTKNRKRYILTLLIFALVSQIPHYLGSGFYMLNILFTFLIAISVILIVENIKLPVLPTVVAFVICVISYFLGVGFFIDYGVFGVLLVLCFYFVKNKYLKLSLASLILILFSLNDMLVYGLSLFSFVYLFALMSIVILMFYNGEKGKLNFKWFFYAFYPMHLLVIYIIGLII